MGRHHSGQNISTVTAERILLIFTLISNKIYYEKYI
jgi:hypothetical protein